MITKVFNLLKKLSLIELKLKILSSNVLSKRDLYLATNVQVKLLIDNNNNKSSIMSLSDVEFKVFSQFGDDGIIQFLISKLQIHKKTFIEFGVENYTESNTRFLLLNNCWSGLVIDGDQTNIDYIKNDSISWSSQLHAKCAFITKENINDLLTNLPFDKEVGILSIDIDGNDFWIWEEINVVNPIVVIVEYNSLFGKNNAWTIPYSKTFVRGPIHSDEISFYGASLEALKYLANKKGYTFIGCNSNGNNSYFIRNDYVSKLNDVLIIPSTQFQLCSFNEIIKNGQRIMGKDRIMTLNGKTVVNVLTGKLEKINFNQRDIDLDHYHE